MGFNWNNSLMSKLLVSDARGVSNLQSLDNLDDIIDILRVEMKLTNFLIILLYKREENQYLDLPILKIKQIVKRKITNIKSAASASNGANRPSVLMKLKEENMK